VHGKKADGTFGVLWLTPQATEMAEADWNFPQGRFLAYVLGPVGDAPALYVALNAAPQAIEFAPPKLPHYSRWKLLLNTAEDKPAVVTFKSGAPTKAAPRSVIVLEGAA
jgi:isoamylase